MKAQLIAYVAALISLVVVDGIWIILVMSKIFQRHVAHLMADSLTWWPILTFYLFFPIGICVFVVRPAVAQNQSLLSVFGFGVLLGLLAYSAYDLTNQATLREWPPFLTLLDIAWGGLLVGVSSVIATWIVKKL